MTHCSAPRVPLHLALFRTWWRLVLVLVMVGEMAIWKAIQQLGGGFPVSVQVAALVLHVPQVLVPAMVLAGVMTLGADLVVRSIIDRLYHRWLAPSRAGWDDQALAFHLGASEQVQGTTPARCRIGPRSEPGILVRSDQRLRFIPHGWDVEPWALPIDQIEGLNEVPPPRPLGGLVRGLRPRLALVVNAPGDEAPQLTVPDPEHVVGWFSKDISTRPEAPPSDLSNPI